MNKNQENLFSSPPKEYRGKPFWAWSGELDKEELKRQIRLMKHMGFGGFFMHSRVGLKTPYLSEKWFDCIKACIDEAKKNDMEAWIYDEDRWPSGAAGGFVTKNIEYRARRIVCEHVTSPSEYKWNKDDVAVFAVKGLSNDYITGYRLLNKDAIKQIAFDEAVIRFYIQIHECSDWYNGYTYLDTMNHQAVQEFIKITHEKYKEEVGQNFGKVIPGFFTDEPNFGHDNWKGKDNFVYSAPWTSALPDVFCTRYGYDIRDHLPELFYGIKGQEVSRALYHFMDCSTFLFCDAFCRQISQWCEKNKISLTGHVLGEDTLLRQLRAVGNAMRFYVHMQMPGIDLLTQYWRIHEAAKQCSSIARQFNKKWRLTETYGCTGWDFSLRGHKALDDLQIALGLNLRCPHISWYTMEGEAKRDYPASIHYQSPWWSQYKIIEDYNARVNFFLAQGKEVRDLLVIHPIESIWCKPLSDWRHDKDTNSLNSILPKISNILLSEHIDFDYGDEELIAKFGRIKIKKNGAPVFSINAADYTTVVIPPMTTIRKTTLNLLAKFKKAGGLIIFIAPQPLYVDALPSKEADTLSKECITVKCINSDLGKAAIPAKRISIMDPDNNEIPSVLYKLTEDKNYFYLFVCNTGYSIHQLNKMDRLDGCWTELSTSERLTRVENFTISGFDICEGSPIEYDPVTGEKYGARTKRINGKIHIYSSLEPIASRLFLVPKKQSQSIPKPHSYKTMRTCSIKSNELGFRRDEPNVFILDMPRYKLGKGKYNGAQDILKIDDIVRKKMGLQVRGGFGLMVQPWAQKPPLSQDRLPVFLKYEFEMNYIPSSPIQIAIENPSSYSKILVNGNMLFADMVNGWWVDKSLNCISIDPSILRVGINELELHTPYSADNSGFEIIYLLGDFSVQCSHNGYKISPPQQHLTPGTITRQGLPFYSGNIHYILDLKISKKNARKILISIKSFKGSALKLTIDGNEIGARAWEPFEFDITNYINGTNQKLVITVFGNRCNSHGPHHIANKNHKWIGPELYRQSGCHFSNKYSIKPLGLDIWPEIIYMT